MKEKLNVVDPYGSGSFEMIIDETGRVISMKRTYPTEDDVRCLQGSVKT